MVHNKTWKFRGERCFVTTFGVNNTKFTFSSLALGALLAIGSMHHVVDGHAQKPY